ncbi:hypothetical protein M9458_053547, partial [Cirrhinus mrigala]
PKIKISHLGRREEETRSCKMSVYEEKEQEAPVYSQRAASPGFSCVSVKSNISMDKPPDLSDVGSQRAASPGFNCVSIKIMFLPPGLSDGPAVTSDPV